MSVAAAFDIKGWCPGGVRPMPSGDGLLVRVRPWCGAFTLDQAKGLAEIAAALGNGHIDLTRRANPLTDALCLDGMRRAAVALPAAVRDGGNREARDAMALSALFSGLALANAGLGAVHGLATERVVFRPLRQARSQAPLIATIGLAMLLQEYLRLTQGAGERWVQPVLAEPHALAGGDGFAVALSTAQIAILLLVACLAGAAGCSGDQAAEEAALITVHVGSTTFTAELALTQAERTRGLGGHEPLAPDEAMLFVFPAPSQETFWMKDVSFPLDFVWISEERQVVEITPDVPPDDGSGLRLYESAQDIQYMLEILGGRAAGAGSVR